VLTNEKAMGIKNSIKDQIEEAERFAEESSYPDAAELTLDVYT
jgi:TPP-dependent pyruvate/acetoin dehydrogenase alpha subunit